MKSLLITTLLLAAGCAAAQSAPADGTGLYLGAAAGRSGFNVEKPALARTAIDDSDAAFKLSGGWMFTPRLGIEAGYAHLGRLEETAGGLRQRGRASALYVAAVGRLPLSDGFALVGRAGVSSGRVQGKALPVGGKAVIGTQVSMMAGAGAEWRIADNMALTMDADYYGRLSKGVQGLSVTFGLKVNL